MLITLDLSNNQLTAVTGFSANAPIASLDLSFNKLTTFTLPGSNLTTVNLSHNALATVVGDPTNLSNLESFDLSNNQLSNIGANGNGFISVGALSSLLSFYIGCNSNFQCSTAIPSISSPVSPMIQYSQCVKYVAQTQEWEPLTYPWCPLGLASTQPGGVHTPAPPAIVVRSTP